MLNASSAAVSEEQFVQASVKTAASTDKKAKVTQDLAELQYALANEEAYRLRMAQVQLATMSFNA
jgi:hypothetical protein